MKILLTGATGFLGSRILKVLLKEKHKVIILKRSFSNTYRIQNELSKVKQYDIDRQNLKLIFDENKNIDVVAHTATCYGRNNESISEIFNSNTFFPLQLLDMSLRNNVATFINTDTNLPLNKDGKMYNYVLSKKQFFEWCVQYRGGGIRKYKTALINVIPQYMYGHYDDTTKFIPFVIEKCMEDAKELDLTEGKQQKDFIYVDDAASAYAAIIKNRHNNFSEYQMGTGKSTSLKKAVLTIKKLTGSSVKLNFGAVPYRKDDKMISKADTKNICSLGWKPKYSFEEGIKKIISLQYTERQK
jgi:nucleoside-diphosphate-sugar epimerase